MAQFFEQACHSLHDWAESLRYVEDLWLWLNFTDILEAAL
jgi:hypothetical protein